MMEFLKGANMNDTLRYRVFCYDMRCHGCPFAENYCNLYTLPDDYLYETVCDSDRFDEYSRRAVRFGTDFIPH